MKETTNKVDAQHGLDAMISFQEKISKKLADLAHHDYEYVPQHQFSWPRKAAHTHTHTLGTGSMHACLAQRILASTNSSSYLDILDGPHPHLLDLELASINPEARSYLRRRSWRTAPRPGRPSESRRACRGS
jgi:hypothetical protein